MNLEDSYSAFHHHPTADTLNNLFSACRDYADRLSSGYPVEDRAFIAQMAVTRAWTTLGTYNGLTRFSTWFHGVVRTFVHEAYTGRLPTAGASDRVH